MVKFNLQSGYPRRTVCIFCLDGGPRILCAGTIRLFFRELGDLSAGIVVYCSIALIAGDRTIRVRLCIPGCRLFLSWKLWSAFWYWQYEAGRPLGWALLGHYCYRNIYTR